jgi:hypothetical protein
MPRFVLSMGIVCPAHVIGEGSARQCRTPLEKRPFAASHLPFTSWRRDLKNSCSANLSHEDVSTGSHPLMLRLTGSILCVV